MLAVIRETCSAECNPLGLSPCSQLAELLVVERVCCLFFVSFPVCTLDFFYTLSQPRYGCQYVDDKTVFVYLLHHTRWKQCRTFFFLLFCVTLPKNITSHRDGNQAHVGKSRDGEVCSSCFRGTELPEHLHHCTDLLTSAADRQVHAWTHVETPI